MPLLVDDGYYYLQIACNVAQGKGFTFDGLIYTNGFHPLWEFHLVVLFLLTKNKLVIAYLAVILQSALFIGSGTTLMPLLHRLGTRKGLVSLCGFFLLLNPWLVNKDAISAIETGLYVFFMGLVLWDHTHRKHRLCRFAKKMDLHIVRSYADVRRHFSHHLDRDPLHRLNGNSALCFAKYGRLLSVFCEQ